MSPLVLKMEMLALTWASMLKELLPLTPAIVGTYWTIAPAGCVRAMVNGMKLIPRASRWPRVRIYHDIHNTEMSVVSCIMYSV